MDMPSIQHWHRAVVPVVFWLAAGAPNGGNAAPIPPARGEVAAAQVSHRDWHGEANKAAKLRTAGLPDLAIRALDGLLHDAIALGLDKRADPIVIINAELGLAQLQAGRAHLAEPLLSAAIDALPASPARERLRIALGAARAGLGQFDEANKSFELARRLAPGDAGIELQSRMEAARFEAAPDRRRALLAMHPRVELAQGAEAAALRLRWASLLMASSPQDTEAIWGAISPTVTMGSDGAQPLLRAQALDLAASLYERQRRLKEALQFNEQARRGLLELPQAQHGVLLATLEARGGRLLRALGDERGALAHYLRAVEHIERIRQDLPIEDEVGRSWYAQLIEPTYTALLDLQLREQDALPAALGQMNLRQVADTLEVLKQSEMQDFLGDRCAVAQLEGGGANPLMPGLATLYTLSLPDRLEMLMVTAQGMHRRTVRVSREELRKAVKVTVERLREGSPSYLRMVQALHKWLWAPMEAVMKEQGVGEVVVVPDGILRLLPFSALHDGKKFVVERYAVSTTTGMTMTNAAPSTIATSKLLLMGMSTPGAVVEKLPLQVLEMVKAGETGTADTSTSRKVNPPSSTSASVARPSAEELLKLRKDLELPGVRDEIASIAKVSGGTSLLDGEFTVERFRTLAETGDYRVIHIASHGMFGGTAETSFIMAHDDIVASDRLQSLLQSQKFQNAPIELLALSACQTAEGNDRAPLGISGVAIRARAKSVLGTLWPVADEAAQELMTYFYAGLRQQGLSKTQALRQAQARVLMQPKMQHPMFWSPFVLIGNWR